jgi:hypothetical protein
VLFYDSNKITFAIDVLQSVSLLNGVGSDDKTRVGVHIVHPELHFSFKMSVAILLRNHSYNLTVVGTAEIFRYRRISIHADVYTVFNFSCPSNGLMTFCTYFRDLL